MNSERAVFHVTRWDGKWKVWRQGRPEGEYDCFETRYEAVARARKLADRCRPATIKID